MNDMIDRYKDKEILKLKKLIIAMFIVCFSFTLTACVQEGPKQNTENIKEETAEEAKKEDVKTPNNEAIVAYFSWSGNTENVAKEIQLQTGADIFEIKPEQPYTDHYDDLLDIAEQEKSEEAIINIEGVITDFETYHTIYLGYPIWWADMPMIVDTFLDDYDMSGKTVIPFCTSGGSGFSASLERIKRMEPDATLLDGLSVLDGDRGNLENLVQSWLVELDMTDE